MERDCETIRNMPESEKQEWIQATMDVIGDYYVQEKITAEFRDKLFKILHRP